MKPLLALSGILILLTVASCASGTEQDRSTGSLRQESIVLEDGRTVECVIYASGYKGGLSCDWESAR